MTETALEKAQRKFEQAKAALDAVKSREADAERKKDTRRKIVLGGALLELAKTDKEASVIVSKLIAALTRDHDKKLFEKSIRKEAAPETAKVEMPAVQPVATPAPMPANEPQGVHASSAMPGYVLPQIRRDRETI